MDFEFPKFISNLVENQFPSFYKEDGENFVLFLKAYYEWMEDDWGNNTDGLGGPIRESRELLDYRDIDNTIEKFLEFFQKKYLYGIPFSVIANKRFLLKHILDVYRSKGTIQCYRLLFKLLYNEDVEIYLPSRDVLRASDGLWIQPRYVEVSANSRLPDYVGKTIIGATSRVTATVEQFVKENYNNDVINVIYITNVTPSNREFKVSEKLVLLEEISDSDAINAAPSVLGSLNNIKVVNSGQNFNIGDVIKIVHRDLSNNDVISFGIDGILKVTEIDDGLGSLIFDITDGGFGFTANASTFVYRNEVKEVDDADASFSIGAITNSRILSYNTDLVCNYSNLQLNTATYGFPANENANLVSTISGTFSYSQNIFGSIFNLDNVVTGNGYSSSANVFVRSTLLSDQLQGNVSYNTSSNTVTGDGSIFTSIFSNGDVIALQSNGSLSSTIELQVIKEVTNSTSIILHGPPSANTSDGKYRAAPTVLPAQYAIYEDEISSYDQVVGENEIITGTSNLGNNIVLSAEAINSGKGYIQGEKVTAYISGGVSNDVLIIESGQNYTNGEILVFAGGNPGVVANGYIMTDGNGSITSTTITYGGSGYESVPVVRVRSTNGSGASLKATIQEFNTERLIKARINKTGIGKGRGYWDTTRGFISADKYIQDSYYYQDYSYEIRVARTLDKYKDIINDTFHVAGTELFGKYLKYLIGTSNANLVYESSSTSSNTTIYLYASETTTTADANTVTVDSYFYEV